MVSSLCTTIERSPYLPPSFFPRAIRHTAFATFQRYRRHLILTGTMAMFYFSHCLIFIRSHCLYNCNQLTELYTLFARLRSRVLIDSRWRQDSICRLICYCRIHNCQLHLADKDNQISRRCARDKYENCRVLIKVAFLDSSDAFAMVFSFVEEQRKRIQVSFFNLALETRIVIAIMLA